MSERTALRTTVACLVAVMMTVAFTAAPAAAAIDFDDGVGIDDVTDAPDGVTDTADDTVDGVTDDSSAAGGDGDVRVRITDTNSPVQAGETLVVTAEVDTETGGEVRLLIDGERVDRKGFAPRQTGTYNFTWETSATDLGDHNATLASGTDSDSRTVTVELGTDPPEETCTNVPERANENVPYEELPSQDDLPEQAPDPPVPPFVTPEAVAGIVVGAAPNQCSIQDPNDPSVDPNDPPTEPSASTTVYRSGQYKDGAVLLVYYEATLDQSGDGPGVSGFAGGIAHSGDAGTNPSVNVNDGEKNYAVDPRFRADDSTADGSAEVSAPFGGVGATLDCSGGECKVTPEGVIQPPENPAIPAPIWDGED